MTREEAVAVLKAFMENPLFSDVHKAAFNIAIHDIKQRHDWDINNLILINKDNYEPLEQEPTTSSELEKNSQKLEKDFGELDCISRAEAIKCLECDFDITGKENMKTVVNYINSAHDKIVNLPSVTPQEPQTFKWCTGCKEYDQEKHCCHRWSKVIRDTVEEMKQEPKTGYWKDIPKYTDIAWKCSECGRFTTLKHNYCPMCGAKMVEPQESEDKE